MVSHWQTLNNPLFGHGLRLKTEVSVAIEAHKTRYYYRDVLIRIINTKKLA
ncbi:MAG: hypothetical protein ACI8R1_001824 [Psychrobacter glaciei]|jgi:hypothetical protein